MALGTARFMVGGALLAESELEFASTVVGRGQESGIVLNHISISRRHARLTIDSGQLFIEDLGSASGTFVNGQRLPPNTSQLIESTSEVRLGDLSFSYEPPPTVDLFSDEPDVPEETPAPEGPPVFVSLAGPGDPIPAGESAELTATLENRGSVVDEYSLSVSGVPDSWVQFRDQRLKLLPGEETTVTISARPPRSSDAPAEDYNLSLSATSLETEQVVQANAPFSIAQFENTSLELRPRRAKKNFRVVATNNGNVPVSYALSATDDEEAFSYDFG